MLIGDFNVNFLVSDTSSQKLLSVTNSFSLTQVVTEPTRISNSSTLIDLIFLSSPSQLSSCVTIPPLANSDHLGLQLSLSTTGSSRRAHSKTERKLWKYNQADFNQAAEMINDTDWNSILSEDINLSWNKWHSRFMEIMHACIPRVTAKSKKTLPWINRHILQLIAKRNSCYRRLKNIADDRRDADLLKYKSLRNRVVGLIREEKRRYFENINSSDQKVF